MHLSRGGVLLADSCCNSEEFDAAFREAISEIFPDQPLVLIPTTHELLSENIMFDISSVKQRSGKGASSSPILEGIEHAGRYCVIYSRHDLSCTWNTVGRNDCAYYESQDAMKIGMNLIVYALKQDLKEIPFAAP